jgi:hypothetical protein
MRVLLVAGIASVLATASFASKVMTADDAQILQTEALADRAPERIHGRFDFMLEDYEGAVDQTTASGRVDLSEICHRVPIQAKRSDGTTVIKRVNVCD